VQDCVLVSCVAVLRSLSGQPGEHRIVHMMAWQWLKESVMGPVVQRSGCALCVVGEDA
jgi:hypothetical protein